MHRIDGYEGVEQEAVVQWLNTADEEIVIPSNAELIEMVQGVDGKKFYTSIFELKNHISFSCKIQLYLKVFGSGKFVCFF